MERHRHRAPRADPGLAGGARGSVGDPTDRTDRTDPLVGRLLDGRYRVEDRIARGGMAGVYHATDTRLDRPVAVKVMHPGLGDDEELAARFVREARAAARLAHPHVVGVYDQGEDQGVVFLAMELVRGHTLRRTISTEAPLAPGRALALIEPVLSALAAAHRAGIVHRDVKPENVLISDDAHGGRVKVADFGLAKAVSADTQHTATGGVLIGTVSYLAPELVVGGTSDARADVYAVGVLLYELLTGHKPHSGESPIQVAYQHVNRDVPPPSERVPALPAYVDALVARATVRDRSLRPADAGVLLHQVHQVAQALRDGVLEDPELVADLAPPAPAPEAAPDTEDSEDTAPTGLATGRSTAVDDRLAIAGAYDRAALSVPANAVAAGVPAAPPAAPASGWSPPPAPAVPQSRRDPDEHRPGPHGAGTPAGPVPPTPGRRSRRGPLLLVLALVLTTAVGAGAWWFGYARYTPVPAVVGLEQIPATQRLEEAGLAADAVSEEYSETVPVGEVLATEPEAGGRVLDGGTVELVVSLGKERYDVPGLAGRTVDQAQDALLATSLGFGETVQRWHPRVAEGTVIRSDPKPGTTLRPDTPVDLVVSRGPKPIKVPDFTGRSAERARTVLDKRGLEAEVSEEYSDDVPEGRVIAQDPDSGTLTKGDAVALTVSLGPELVEVPTVRASGVDSATEKLEAAGFVVRVEESSNYLGLGYVLSSDPGGGELAPKGSTITLFLV